MGREACLTQSEQEFVREQRIHERFNGQKRNDNGWDNNGEVVKFYHYRMWHEIKRLRELLSKNGIDPGPESDWFEIPKVGPGTDRIGIPVVR